MLAQQERKARYRLEHVETATAPAATWQLSGTKSIVPAGDRPMRSWFGASGARRRRIALFLGRRKGEPGVAARHRPRTAPAPPKYLDARRRRAARRRPGLTALEHAVDIGIAAMCAEAVGVMDKTMVAITVEYMNTRKQFGVPIATFQALRHRIADVKMQLELARSMSYFATLKLGEAPAPARRRALAQAKLQLGKSMRFVGQQCIQLHGGIGVTDEYIASHYFKRLTVMEMTFGDTLHQLGEVSARMQDTAGVFARVDAAACGAAPDSPGLAGPFLVAMSRGGALTAVAGIKVGHFTDRAGPPAAPWILAGAAAPAPASTCAAARPARARPTCSIRSTHRQRPRASSSPAAARSASTPPPASCAGSRSTASARVSARAVGPDRRADRAGGDLFDLWVGDPAHPARCRRRLRGPRGSRAAPVPRATSAPAPARRSASCSGIGRAMKGGGRHRVDQPSAPSRWPRWSRSTRSATSSIRAPGRVVAGARTDDGKTLWHDAGAQAFGRVAGAARRAMAGTATTIGVVATDAVLTKAEANKVAQMAHDGLARSINPVHTMSDGDVVFALATGASGKTMASTLVGALAADVLAEAVFRAVRAAQGIGGEPGPAPSLTSARTSNPPIKPTETNP